MIKQSAFRMFLVAAVAGTVAACGGLGLEQAKMTSPHGSAFHNSLYSGYVGLAQAEFDEGDYKDSDEFAQRAMTAAKGDAVFPEEIAARKLPADSVPGLTSARGRLIKAFDAGAAQKIPTEIAKAQVMFDCWMQEQEENFQPKDIAKCKADFEQAMAKVDDALKPMVAAKPAPKPAPMAKKPAPMPGPWEIYFGFDSTELSAVSLAIIKQAAEAAAKVKPSVINVIGHADRAGDAQYNLKLSQFRANAVANALMEDGVSRDLLDKSYFGESDPNVPTDDGMRERANRLVVIRFAK